MSAVNEKKSTFWANLLRALETEPRTAGFVRGASGLEHPVIAVGVDDARRRLLLVSGEHDARSAAIAQLDIQTAIQSVQVVVARPLVFNLAPVAKQIVDFLGGPVVADAQLQERLKALAPPDKMQELLGPSVTRLMSGIEVANLNWVAQIMQVVQQLGMIDVEFTQRDGAPPSGTFRLERLANLDPTELDRHLGICPVSLYEITPCDAETIQSGTDLDAVREVLRRQHLLQFFFPSPDQLALGLVDRGVQQPSRVLDGLTRAPDVGHPFGPSEMTASDLPIGETIDALQEKGLLVEGEIGLEMSSAGKSVRADIRFKPREGIVSKIANNFSIKLDLKDLFRPSGS